MLNATAVIPSVEIPHAQIPKAAIRSVAIRSVAIRGARNSIPNPNLRAVAWNNWMDSDKWEVDPMVAHIHRLEAAGTA